MAVYGNFARNIGGINTTPISEIDSVLEFLSNEAAMYRECIVNESFISDEDRMVLEAKIEAINEAVTGAIIAAVVAIIGAIIALIAKFTGMLKKGSVKIKARFDEVPKEITLSDEQIKELNQRIDDLVDGVNYNRKDILKKYSDLDIISTPIISTLRDVAKRLPSTAKQLVSSAQGSNVDAALEDTSKINEDINSAINKMNQMGIDKDMVKDHNIFFDAFVQHSYEAKNAINACKDFINSGYYDRTVKIQDEINRSMEESKKTIESNQRKILAKLHPDNHLGDDNGKWNDLASTVSGCFSNIKDWCSIIKTMMQQWAEAEKFRLSFCNICASYAK